MLESEHVFLFTIMSYLKIVVDKKKLSKKFLLFAFRTFVNLPKNIRFEKGISLIIKDISKKKQ